LAAVTSAGLIAAAVADRRGSPKQRSATFQRTIPHLATINGDDMPDTLEGRPKEIITGKNYAHLAIPRQDGTVQTVIVWAHADDGNVTLNSSEGRTWPENLRKAGTATVTVMADGDPHDGADEQINALAKKYIGADEYPYRVPGEQRIRFALRPERVHYNPPK